MGSCLQIARLQYCTLQNTKPLTFEGKSMWMKVIDVYDGDTVTVAYYLHGHKYWEKMRLAGIDSPEMRPRKDTVNREVEIEWAKKAKQFLVDLSLNKVCFVRHEKRDKYGRLMGHIYSGKNSISFNEMLVEHGLAVKYDGKKKTSFHIWHRDLEKNEK